jgi:AcrR family transcriptional regulator
MSPRGSSASTRVVLSRKDWIHAGQDLLREGGVPAVKLHALTSRLGVTTGSFYHHFADFSAYLEALAGDYSKAELEAAFAAVADEAPADRLRLLFRLTTDWDIPPLDRAMRVWAATNPSAEAAVARMDQAFLEFLTSIFSELGLPDDDARLRALLAFSASAALVFTPWPRTDADVERAIALLTAPLPQ